MENKNLQGSSKNPFFEPATEPAWTHPELRVHLDPTTGVALILLASSAGPNRVHAAFAEGLKGALAFVKAWPERKGIVLGSARRDFCVGADLDLLLRERDPRLYYDMVRGLDLLFRELETAGVPVVAALTGSALGGGCELALSCHRRIALDLPELQIGLPEVNLGLIPGAGGTQRLPRLIGIQAALEIILQGKVLRAPAALTAGIVDDLAPDIDTLFDKAKAWILANPNARQPWDRPNWVFPPPAPNSDAARDLFMAGMALLYKKTAGAFPAAEAALRVVQEGTRIQFDRALELEARAFARLASSTQARDMIRTFFFHKNAADKHEGLPRANASGIQKVGILGAGMMGASLAWTAAQRGFQVVLRDLKPDVLEKARNHAEYQARDSKGMSAEERLQALARIHTTTDLSPLQGCDLVIEAVFENMELKHRVIREVEPLLAPQGIFASNTSALPIGALAQASLAPERFIGLHFFSPVEKMPLIEIICGPQSSDQTLARSLAFARAIRKTPIVVADGYGFYTTRVFSAYILEGAELVAQGHDPALVEWAARSAGMVAPPLQVFDEISLRLGKHVLSQAREYLGERVDIAGARLVMQMVDEHDRPGRAEGRGFYEYDSGKRLGFWPGLSSLVAAPPEKTGIELVRRRLLLAQVAEVARVWDEGILLRARDAELGAILGFGFAPNTGGPLAFMDAQGIPALVAELDTLASHEGSRFEPAPVLRRMAHERLSFYGSELGTATVSGS